LRSINNLSPRPFFRSHRFKGRNEIIRLLNQFYYKSEYKKIQRPDIFHPTYYHQYFLESIGDLPFVLTIYDMAHEMYPGLFHPLDFTVKNKRALAIKAARVIAISEHTKNDVVRFLGVPDSNIDVIPLATDIRMDVSVKYPDSLPKDFILYVGARNTYKNFLFFLRAVQEIFKDSKNLSVICAGGGTFSASELKQIENLGLSKKIVQVNVSDGLLALLYNKSKAFVYPSLYEGFGIPVLEAFTCGAPAVLSNRSSLPEVGGEAAVYFDPENIDSLVTVLHNVIHQKDAGQRMIVKGYERAKLFSWHRTADQTIDTYNKIINGV
jgi:glycosyltransferase involved in cell wall biosynthesis